jgi:hypothetical protein
MRVHMHPLEPFFYVVTFAFFMAVLLNIGNRLYWYYKNKGDKHGDYQYKSSGCLGQIVLFLAVVYIAMYLISAIYS